ncbi:hypothetical protein MFLAVUS_007218 [Mucor flavus]|uniref:F-box domain-containing protein n=1 Tax=Mucor flavus TaxID=439312 RepID=A0ABP9Z3P3_9FUNG
MRDLPAEIYANIFQYLKREDLQKCHLVCTRWHTMAIPFRWEEVKLGPRNIALVKSHFKELDLNQYFRNSHLIKKLTFQNITNCKDVNRFSRLELLDLLNHLPNLNEIDFNETKYPEEYLGFLLDADMRHINNIDTGSELRHIPNDLLFSVYYKFRNSITCIRLGYDRDTFNFDSQEINILNSLTQFKKLTKLVLYNFREINLTQDDFPNLEYLEYLSRHPISESAMRHVLDHKRIIDLNFISSLTSLELSLPSLTATYTIYLVEYFPNQLTDLRITITHQIMFDWIRMVGMELASRLMEKAGSIDKTYIGFVLSDRYDVRTSAKINMTEYFKLLNSFRGTRKARCTANFAGAVDKIRGLGYTFRYESFNRLFVTYDLYGMDLRGYNAADTMAVPDRTSSIIGLEIFDVLGFSLSILYGTDDLGRVLSYSFLNFPRLRTLKIAASLWHEGYSLTFRHKNEKISSDQAIGDINFLEAENFDLSKNFVKLVTTHLPNIETVSLKDKYWGCRRGDKVVDLTEDYYNQDEKNFLIKYTNGTERRIREDSKMERMVLNFRSSDYVTDEMGRSVYQASRSLSSQI